MQSPYDLFDIRGRVALVTGASSGIGRSLAQALARAGARVVLLARREAQLEATLRSIERDGGQAAVLACDLLDPDVFGDLAQRAAHAFGDVEILIQSAGINPRVPALQTTPEIWERTLRLNLTVPFLLAQCLVPPMQRRGWGRIVNIASLQSVRAFPDSIAYGASKGGVVQLTRAMAEAWSAHGVLCNAIAPGYTPTELTASITAQPEVVAQLATRTMVGRNGTPEDLYGVMLLLVSGAGSFITGQTIFVDGGFTSK
ncbi:MAG: SDR family oxidoreductase [Betaproteobacteria bacterium]|nr:SDR family oxidoreductase [Betaproteobacteria bacterium]